jgi:tetratricopeptide (TPR) repeat protein
MKGALFPGGAVLALVPFLLFSPDGAFAQTRADALAEYRNGNYEAAAGICKNELALDPNNIESHVVICWSLIALGRYEEAAVYALNGRTLSRYDPRIVEILAEIAYYQGRNQEALERFQEYVNLAPEGGRIDMVYYFIGEIYIRLGRFRHADIALSTAVHYVPGNAAWWTRLGYARENAAGRPPPGRQARAQYALELQEALRAYEQALALNSLYSDARRGLDRVRQAMAGLILD